MTEKSYVFEFVVVFSSNKDPRESVFFLLYLKKKEEVEQTFPRDTKFLNKLVPGCRDWKQTRLETLHKHLKALLLEKDTFSITEETGHHWRRQGAGFCSVSGESTTDVSLSLSLCSKGHICARVSLIITIYARGAKQRGSPHRPRPVWREIFLTGPPGGPPEQSIQTELDHPHFWVTINCFLNTYIRGKHPKMNWKLSGNLSPLGLTTVPPSV